MEKLKGTKSWRLESQYIDIQISSIARERHIHHNAARSHAPISSSLRCRSRNPLWKIRYKSWDQWNSVSTDDHTKPYNALRNTACGRGSLTSLKGEDLTRGERVAPGFTKVRNKSSTPRLLKKTVRTYVFFFWIWGVKSNFIFRSIDQVSILLRLGKLSNAAPSPSCLESLLLVVYDSVLDPQRMLY